VLKIDMRADSTPVIVQHRFSEFELFWTILTERYTGLTIPPLPEKLMNQSEDIVGVRRRILTFFVQLVIRNPFLRNDKLWLDFITPGVKLTNSEVGLALARQGGRRALMAASRPQIREERESELNMGYSRWMQAVQETPDLPEDFDADAQFQALITEARQLE
jgi:hypothetical protein